MIGLIFVAVIVIAIAALIAASWWIGRPISIAEAERRMKQRGSFDLGLLAAAGVCMLLVAVAFQQWRVERLTAALATANAQITQRVAERAAALAAAEQCSMSVAALKAEADQRVQAAEVARKQAGDRARAAEQEAHEIMATPASVKDNDAASAEARIDRWLASR